MLEEESRRGRSSWTRICEGNFHGLEQLDHQFWCEENKSLINDERMRTSLSKDTDVWIFQRLRGSPQATIAGGGGSRRLSVAPRLVSRLLTSTKTVE